MTQGLMALILGAGLLSGSANALEAPAKAYEPVKAAHEASKQVKYKSGKDIDFEALLIQGQIKRPEITVVTGDAGQGTDGLLRLRENFLDRMAEDFGEEAK